MKGSACRTASGVRARAVCLRARAVCRHLLQRQPLLGTGRLLRRHLHWTPQPPEVITAIAMEGTRMRRNPR